MEVEVGAEERRASRGIGRYAALLVLFTGLQCGAEYLGLSWAGVQGGLAAPVWIGTAVAVSIVYFAGYRYIPAIAAGAMLAALSQPPIALVAVLGSGASSAGEAAVAALILRRFDFRPTFDRLRDVVALDLGVAVVATATSATLGVAGLRLSGTVAAPETLDVWSTWWFANAASAVVLAPAILFAVGWWQTRPPLAPTLGSPLFYLSVGMLAGVSVWVFLLTNNPQEFALPFVVFPFAFFVALRYGPIGAIASNLTITVIALIGTYRSVGPFGTHLAGQSTSLGDELLATQVFVVTVAVTGLALAAAIAERESARDKLSDTERRYRSLVEHVPAGIYLDAIEDPDAGRVTTMYISPQIEEMLGCRAEEFKEDPDLWARLRHPDDRARVFAQRVKHYQTGEPLSTVSRMITPGDRELWLREEAVVLTGVAGHERVSQGVVVDITDLIRSQRERERLRERMVNAQEEERRRIAADIHDDSVQGMTAVGLRLEMLRKKVASGESDNEAFQALERDVAAAIRRLRHLMFELRPPALDEQGLAAAVEGFLAEEARSVGLRFEMKNVLETEPDPAVQAGLYRIAQEALRNVVKHAHASRVIVSIGSANSGVTLQIEDDGKGIPAGGYSSAEHFGLAGIQERAAMMGGWAHIESSPGEGTTLQVWVPS